jgi:hypothetical protein
MAGKLNNDTEIPFAVPNLTDLWYFANPSTGKGFKNVVSALLTLLGAGIVPITAFADKTALLAGTSIVANYFAYVAADTGGWALYIYLGGDKSLIASYQLVASEGGLITIDPTSGIALDFDNKRILKFVSTATFAVPKTITVPNSAAGKHFDYTFTITDVAAVITVPVTFKLSDVRKIGNDITLLDVGRYKMVGDWDGTNWNIELTQSPYN